MRNRAWLILSLLLSPWACAAETYGMRYEVSLDGLTWSSNVNVPPESVVKFRVSAYFEPGVTVTTTDGPGTAVAVSRFTGSQQVVGFGGGDVFQNLVRLAPSGNPALLSASGTGVIGLNTITSFASQVLLDLTPYLQAPEFKFPILRGEIRLSTSLEPRTLTISNKTFGSGSTPGLTFYHSGSPINRQSARPDDSNVRQDVNAAITVVGGGCPSPGYDTFTSTPTAQPSVPAVFTVTSAIANGYEWYRNGVRLADSTRYTGLTSSTLTIPHPVPSDAGSYRCRVSSVCFTYTTTFPLSLTIACGADLAPDGLVDDVDFLQFVAAYNEFVCPTQRCPADLNVDGFVDDLDFGLFAVQYDSLLCP